MEIQQTRVRGGVRREQNRPAELENLVGDAVGSFLVLVVLLIAGLVLWGKAKDAGRFE